MYLLISITHLEVDNVLGHVAVRLGVGPGILLVEELYAEIEVFLLQTVQPALHLVHRLELVRRPETTSPTATAHVERMRRLGWSRRKIKFVPFN